MKSVSMGAGTSLPGRPPSTRTLEQDQRGITGLETAIVLIAFVVVASVFAFAVLTTRLLSSEKSKETVLGGLEETSSSVRLSGSVVAHATTTNGEAATALPTARSGT